jgi:thioredoxin reductase (NADPH)
VAQAMPTLSQDQMLWATRNAEVQKFEAGTLIFSEGSNADTFYIVSKGMVDVVLPRQDQSDVIALQLGPGKFFGEIAYFHDRKRLASIRASEHTPVEVLAIGYDKLNELLNQSEATRDALHQKAELHEEQNLQKRGLK